MFSRAPRWLTAMLLAVVICGCERSEPMTQRIEAPSVEALARWRLQNTRHYPHDQWKEFESALDEARWAAITEIGAMNADALAEKVRVSVDDLSFRAVLQLGAELKLERLERVRAELKESIDGNALLAPKPGDIASANHLARFREQQRAQLQRTDLDLAATERRLAELGGRPVGKRERDQIPTVVSRAQVLAEIDTMIEARRAVATFRYGSWPLKIDRDGASLKGDERDRFTEKRREAERDGRTVIAVRIKGRWLIYDDRTELPAFEQAVTANLTPADLRAIGDKWAVLQAELWAREKAASEIEPLPDPPPVPRPF